NDKVTLETKNPLRSFAPLRLRGESQRIGVQFTPNLNRQANINTSTPQHFNTYFLANSCSRSINLLEYPHSLSYHATTLTKWSLRAMPALASKIEVRPSPRKS